MKKPLKGLFKAARFFLIFSLFTLFIQSQSQAQGDFGIGLQLGSPSGITAKMYNPRGMSLEFLGAWDSLRDMYFLNIHGLFEQPIGRGPTNVFYGPGGFLGGERQRDTFRNGDVFVAGISGTVGISIFFGSLEVYGQATPRLGLIGLNSFAVGGGIGARYYF